MFLDAILIKLFDTNINSYLILNNISINDTVLTKTCLWY